MKSFGGSAEGGPPTGARFFEKEELSAVLGADQAGGNDFRVIEHKKVSGGEEGWEVTNREIGDFVCRTAYEEQACGVPGMSG